MLDALETAVARLQARKSESSPQEIVAVSGPGIRPDTLKETMRRVGLSPSEFASVMGVPRLELNAWLDGRAVAPYWVIPAIHLFSLLTRQARLRLLRGPTINTGESRARIHPFVRIEEL
jgi:hypothetical protein